MPAKDRLQSGSAHDASSHGRARRRALAIAAFVGVAFAALAFAGSSTHACAVCHRAPAEVLAAGAHPTAGCYACHLSHGWWGLAERKELEFASMYPLALVGAGLQDPPRQTSRDGCLGCHGAILEGVTEAGGLRIRHGVCAPDPSCDTCHASVAHGTAVRWRSRPVMDRCTSCHERRGATVRCEDCHVGRNDARGDPGPWQVTHGPEWRTTHGMGELGGCATCHQDGFCEKCHRLAVPHPASFGAEHGSLAQKDPDACRTCHPSTALCDACHGMPMPHPAGFLATHPVSAAGDSDPRCTRCHVPGDCGDCHDNHVHPGGSTGVPSPRQHVSR